MPRSTPSFTQWHHLFGLVVADVFADSPWEVELEKDLSQRRQMLDLVIIRRRAGEFTSTLPDGLIGLRDHNLLGYKSLHEPFDAWAMEELIGHYVNYRKQLTRRDEPLIPEARFRRYTVATRRPQKLFEELRLYHSGRVVIPHDLPGIFDVQWGTAQIRLIVTDAVRKIPENALWHLFSAHAETVEYGCDHYHAQRRDLSSVLSRLFDFYQLEGLPMSYTLEDFVREYVRDHIDLLPPEERLRGLDPEDRLEDLSIEEIEHYLQKVRKQLGPVGLSLSRQPARITVDARDPLPRPCVAGTRG